MARSDTAHSKLLEKQLANIYGETLGSVSLSDETELSEYARTQRPVGVQPVNAWGCAPYSGRQWKSIWQRCKTCPCWISWMDLFNCLVTPMRRYSS